MVEMGDYTLSVLGISGSRIIEVAVRRRGQGENAAKD